MTNPKSQTTQEQAPQSVSQPGRETIFDDSSVNTKESLPAIISQIDEMIKECKECGIVVVWDTPNGDIGIIANRDTLRYTGLLAMALRRIKKQIFDMLEC